MSGLYSSDFEIQEESQLNSKEFPFKGRVKFKRISIETNFSNDFLLF